MTEIPTSAETGQQGFTFASMLEKSMSCGLLVFDPGGNVISITPEAERVLQLVAGTASASDISAMPAPIKAVVHEVQSTRRPISDHQVALESPIGVIDLMITALPFAPAPDSVSVILVLKDAAGTPRLDPSLTRLDRLASVGTLSASMAHEIKNALVAIKAFVDLLIEKNADSDLASVVRREIGRVDSIVSHMLQFSAPSPPSFSAIEIHKILDHSLRLVQHRVGQKQIAFKKEFNASTDTCRGNDHQIEQAFVNLLFNAVDAISAEGTLTLSTDLVGAEIPALREGAHGHSLLRVRITDTGTGISPEHMNRIFEPFFTTKQNGTGLGLAVTRRIISEHRGSMHVESLTGKGTTFVVLLPATTADVSA